MYLNLIHVEDAAGAVAAAAELKRVVGRTYVVSDGSPPTRGEYVGLLAMRQGVAPPLFTGGPGLGKRVRNTQALEELGMPQRYPSYREGLAGE